MEEKYGKCRTFDGRPQTISFQDVERGGLRGNFWHFVILCCCFKGELENQILYFCLLYGPFSSTGIKQEAFAKSVTTLGKQYKL